MNIAQIISEQLKSTTNLSIIWSWGATAWQSLSQKDLISLGINNGFGALKFKVNAHHHKGHILIVLNGLDLYDIYLCSIRIGKLSIKEKIENVDFTNLGKIIDDKIERIPEYSF